MVGEVCEVFVVCMVGEVCEVFVVCMVGEVYDATKSENGGVLTSRFRGEEYLFCQSRGRDDVKLVEKVSKSSSFATIGPVQAEISSFASRAQIRYRFRDRSRKRYRIFRHAHRSMGSLHRRRSQYPH